MNWDRQQLQSRVLHYYERYELQLSAAFFAAGVLFDILTLGRIDSWANIVQQAIYLALLALLLGLGLLWRAQLFAPPKWLAKAWAFRDFAVHFLIGSLLSAYSIFYFKSATFVTSFVFLGMLFAIMVVNELEAFKRRGPIVKYALLALCLASFFAYVIPVVFGTVGPVTFTASLVISALCMWGQAYWLLKRGLPKTELIREIGIPGTLITLVFLGFYLLRAIPPVPLSIQYMAVFHGIDKKEGNYYLLHENPWWRFWQEGDETFLARPGDKVYGYARIFSPSRFKDRVYMRWQLRDSRSGRWINADAIPMEILGGREQGFRGYSVKANHQPGEWRLSVETTDGREIGRFNFTIETDTRDPSLPREMVREQG